MALLNVAGFLSRKTLIFFLLSLSLVACGKKTPLVPPPAKSYAAINDLRYELDDKGVTLLWSVPSRPEGNKKNSREPGFEVLKAEVPAADYCPDCPVRFNQVLAASTPLAAVNRRDMTCRDSGLKAGYWYYYKIRFSADFLGGGKESNVVSFQWMPAQPRPEPPAGEK